MVLARLLFLLCVLVLALPPAAAADDVFEGVERIVAIGDVHGDYDQFFTLLRQTGLVDEDADWTGGAAHLVQTGDVPDRGPDTRQIMDLLMKLERQASNDDGAVHALIGNHEAMNVYGDLRYVTEEEFAAFRTPDSRHIREQFWDEHKREAAAAGKNVDQAYKDKWFEEHPLGYFEHRFAWGPRGDYGKWVTDHNAAIQVNDTLFVHGGIGPEYADSSVREINKQVPKELEDFSLLKEGMVLDSNGPLWYRGLAQGELNEMSAHVDTVLANYGVKRIVIGHTPTAGTVLPRFGGKVILIDVGLSEAYGGRLACLVMEGGKTYTIHRGEKLELPDGGRELIAYIRRAAELDPAPSPLLPLIQ